LRDDFLPFCRPVISEEEIAAVGEVLRSGWITTGPGTTRFEERFSDYVNASGAVAVSSATAGMHIALKAMGIGPGDEVITPSMTWVSTVNLIVLAGATPVFADVDRDTLNVSAESVEKCLTSRTKLIIPVHFAGGAVDMKSIRSLAGDRDLAIIEDAAHAVGTRTEEGLVGGTGTSIFSFHPIKVMTTGEGGMICSDDDEFLATTRRLRFHGLGADAWERTSQGRVPQAEVLEPGYKYNLTDVAAVFGLSQLERLETFIDLRQELVDIYRQRLPEVESIIPLADPVGTSRHSRSLFVVRLDGGAPEMDRDLLMARLKERNIGTGLHFRAVHEHAYYRRNPGLWRGDLPNTEWNSRRIFSLPLFPGMSSSDVHQVVDELKGVLAS
jgi:UDP-4-amino-4-deoxy-L-arabinose-oxoglutarate aminotransferase